MDKENRNRIMDSYFGPDGIPCCSPGTLKEVIRECDKLARAWDAFYEWAAHWGPLARKMDELLPPAPKDPLDELEEFIKGESIRPHDSIHGSHAAGIPEWIRVEALLAEIRRLKETK